MNGAGISRPGAPSAAEELPANRKLPVDFCNQREGRAHPVAARYPAHRRVERWRRPSKVERAAKHRLPGWESSSRFTGRPDSTKLRHEAREACSESEADTLVGRGGGQLPGEALTCRASLGSPSTCRANGEAVERTRVPSRRSEPRLFTAALRWLHRSRTKASIFHAYAALP
jgi:hypothetical protein